VSMARREGIPGALVGRDAAAGLDRLPAPR
jgi:hypothetical protein